jgi:DNA-binding GntR family transcriptional regulator
MSAQADSGSPPQLRDWVEEQLREAILDGEFDPGTWLRQQQLADELGVSQMPIREALKELVAQGLAEHIPYRGVRVREYSADDIADIYEIRAFLEAMAARVAAERIMPEELEELRAVTSRMEGCSIPEERREHRELNSRFHEVVFTASRRAYLIHILRQLWMVFPSMLWRDFPPTDTELLAGQDAYDPHEHQAIIAALEEGNSEQAEQLMRQHIEDAGSRLLLALQEGVDSVSSE